jgi:UDP-N-acetylglucosamine 1-carboxyvinyltransferase
MGAEIHGAGSDRIVVSGVKMMRGVRHRVAGDRIEAGTLLAAAVTTGGEVHVTGVDPADMQATLDKLAECGAELATDSSSVHLRMTRRPQPLQVTTAPFPGFPTDMQAQLMATLCVAQGASVVTERVFENRFMHVPELQRMGADITLSGRAAHVRGVARLSGAQVMATDLRASAGLVVAALAAEGETIISRVYHIDRGYERIEEKLRKLGAEIRREG